MNAVTCTYWLKSGVLLQKSKKHVPNVKIPKTFKTNHKDDESEADLSRIVDDYDLNDYSSEDEDISFQKSVAAFSNNIDDPYMKQSLLEDSSEDEDILSTDSALVVGKTHRDYHSLEVWIVNRDDEAHLNSYCHHDYILPSCPLDIECFSNVNVNLAAVSSLESSIMLWDLDSMNVVEPVATLGDEEDGTGHTDAVLCISHKLISSDSCLLLSGSADGTICLWDVNSNIGRCVQKSNFGCRDKVQAVQWHPVEDSIFAAGFFDKMVNIYDCRTCYRSNKADCTWAVDGEVEKILWDVHLPFNLYTCTSSGAVHFLDIRMDKPLWVLDAHSPASATGLSQCAFIKGCLLTTSDEGKTKVWDVRSTEPELIATKSYKIGSIFCSTSSPDHPMLFCVGGEREMKIVDLNKDTRVCERFKRDGGCSNLEETSGNQQGLLKNGDNKNCRLLKNGDGNRPEYFRTNNDDEDGLLRSEDKSTHLRDENGNGPIKNGAIRTKSKCRASKNKRKQLAKVVELLNNEMVSEKSGAKNKRKLAKDVKTVNNELVTEERGKEKAVMHTSGTKNKKKLGKVVELINKEIVSEEKGIEEVVMHVSGTGKKGKGKKKKNSKL